MTNQLVTIEHSLPTPIVAVSAEVLAEANNLRQVAQMIGTVDAETLEDASATAGKMAKLEKSVEKQRKEIKAPVIDLGKQIDAAARDAMAPLKMDRIELAGKIAIYHRKVQEERQRIEAENRRKIEEATRRAEEEQRKRDAAREAADEAHRKAAEAATNPSLFNRILGNTPEMPPEPEPESAVPLAPIPVALEKPPEPVKSSVSVRKVKKVRIIDESKIPIEINGARLWKLDEVAIRRVALAGIPIPGVEVVEEDQLATRSA